VCTPGFIAPSFFDWLRASAPTWYTAVPTMHQAVVARAAEHRSTIENARLRFIRSSSAALPRQTLAELERAFGVPVIEAYGMTEAAHQMASNPLPPRERKAGTVGTAAGPEIAIMDADGQLLQAGEIGEVVIRGENVTRGYAANPAANAAAFAHGWLRTGDQGSLDAEGYLTLSGRLKEQINRAGEKISPLEVDEILMDHAGVAQALTFAVPHPTLGEDVGAAVVRRPDSSVTERQLREFASLRLSYFKVPRRIVFLDEIPKGATGKLQRIGLAQRLGVTADAAPEVAHVAPRTPIEEIIASLWVEVLRSEVPGVHDDFFRAGGDSLLATQLVARIRDALAVELSLLDFFDASTIAGLASIADARVTGVA
jgi:acyl-CoA synthetase (AMP-forming)/AMP-acid ligase II/acyl carrier protein